MSKVEIEILLLSFLWALAVTRMLESFGGLWIARARVRFSLSQLLWMTAILLCCLFYGFPLTTLGDKVLDGWQFLGSLIYGLGLYFAATVASPKIAGEGVIDLADYETREGKGYKVTFIFLMLLALPLNYAFIPADAPMPPLLRLVLIWWSVTATLIVYVIGLTHNVRVRTICAALAVFLALYGFAQNLGAPN